MKKDILFALLLWSRIVGMFLVCSYVGIRIDRYLQSTPIVLLLLLLFAFVYTIRLLLGVGKHE